MPEKLTFKRLCDAAVTMGEMSQGTADYFLGLYLQSDECRDLAWLRRYVTELEEQTDSIGLKKAQADAGPR